MNAPLEGLDGTQFDVCIIGGGINGTSTAALLAKDGYRVLLVERNDFGSGTSGRSSRLLHCGLNQVGGLRDAKGIKAKIASLSSARVMMIERTNLVSAMPERLVPTRFYVPLTSQGPAKPWQLRAAFLILRTLGSKNVPLDYKEYSHASFKSTPILARLNPKFTSAISFTEFVFDCPEGICVDYVRQAERFSATVRNYTELVSAKAVAGGWELGLSDCADRTRSKKVHARLVLNLCGPWSDFVNAQFLETPPRTLTLTKGCHVAVRLPAEFEGQGIVTATDDGHMFICTPWRGFHILGPTEQVFDGDPVNVSVDPADVAGILQKANALLPQINLTASDVMWSYAGVRPVTFEKGHRKGVWRREIHDLSTQAGASLISLSWGRVVDHADSARKLAELVNRRLPARRGERSCGVTDREIDSPTLFPATPRTVEDVLFRRTGQGWDADLGCSHAAAVAEQLAKGKAGHAENLYREYVKMLEVKFGYFAMESDENR